MDPSVLPVGESNLSIYCGDLDWFFTTLNNRNENLKLQLRNNTDNTWTSVSELNGAGVFSENKNASFDGFTSFSLNWTNLFSNHFLTLEGSVQSKQCTVDPQKYPGVRCVLSNGSRVMDSTEKRIFTIKGGCIFGLSCFLYFQNIIYKCM